MHQERSGFETLGPHGSVRFVTGERHGSGQRGKNRGSAPGNRDDCRPGDRHETTPLQVVSIDHIDPADLMSLDPNQLDHDPILKALATGYQQAAARTRDEDSKAITPSSERRTGRS